jgi:hypothetical protein
MRGDAYKNDEKTGFGFDHSSFDTIVAGGLQQFQHSQPLADHFAPRTFPSLIFYKYHCIYAGGVCG